MDNFTLTGEVNSAIICSFFYGDLSPEIVEFLSSNIDLVFHKNDVVRLIDDDLQVNMKNSKEKKLLSYTIRKMVGTRL